VTERVEKRFGAATVVLGLLTFMLTVVMAMLRGCSAALTNLPHR